MAWQLVKFLIAAIFIFFLIKKNPEKSDFVKAAVKEYSLSSLGLSPALANGAAELSANLLSKFLEPMIERNDYIFFSTYSFEYNNKNVKIKIKAFGIWDSIFFYDSEVKKLNDTESKESL